MPSLGGEFVRNGRQIEHSRDISVAYPMGTSNMVRVHLTAPRARRLMPGAWVVERSRLLILFIATSTKVDGNFSFDQHVKPRARAPFRRLQYRRSRAAPAGATRRPAVAIPASSLPGTWLKRINSGR